MASSTILTIGHSTHPIEEFLEILAAHKVRQIADVRTIPKSRRNPQFNREELAATLKHQRIRYIHLPELGGLRHAHKDSINTAWRNDSFRGYADYMQTPEFEEAVRKLIELAAARRTAIMCAEAVPWRCHRSLIGDALIARGIAVEDIFSKNSRKAHTLTPFARVEGERVTYPGLV
ncbi:MAG TPA: DUF488 domain-containing protein [Bryobacteraceae bacterium]|nr:DUF488 domain-containing protein [Bryobacteraceae bacterium]